MIMYGSILVPIDGSENSARALKHAAQLARMVGAKLVLFHAAPHIHMALNIEGINVRRLEEVDGEAKRARDVAAKRLLAAAHRELGFDDLAVEELFVVSSNPYEAIIEAAKKYDCDLIVMASHGHHGVAGVLLGSETQKVLTHSKIPVTVVH